MEVNRSIMDAEFPGGWISQIPRRMHESAQRFRRAETEAALLVAALETAFATATRAWYVATEQAYLEAHGTLPGSERTKRLRKKRRTMVLRWWESTSEED